MAWDPPSNMGTLPILVRYDVLRSSVAADFTVADCIEWGDGPNTVAVDVDTPAPGSAFHYLTRAWNECPQDGLGSLGTNSAGEERPGTDCR
jgi:hypothetical protein